MLEKIKRADELLSKIDLSFQMLKNQFENDVDNLYIMDSVGRFVWFNEFAKINNKFTESSILENSLDYFVTLNQRNEVVKEFFLDLVQKKTKEAHLSFTGTSFVKEEKFFHFNFV